VDNPYKGLHAFAEGDADQFFGRERLVDELLAHLEGVDGKFLAVVGASGCGKSSVVRAGLVPALRNGRVEGSEDWFITTMAPGSHPFEALESAFLRIAVNPPASLLSQLEGDRRGIVRATRRILPDDDGTAVLVIDQFEELFTLCRDEAVRAKFLQSLTAAVDDPATTLRIIITLRADFYDQPLRYEGFAELLKRHAVTVTPLFADELEQAILGPAQSVGAEFEPGLVAEMVADVTSQPSALPLMQYALTQLFDARVSGILMVSAYRRLGGLSGALAGRADELFGDLESDVQQAARRLFGRLVTLGEGSEDTRRRVTRSELGRGPAVDRVIDVFGAARLLSFDRDTVTRAPTIEVAHEALIREWPRLRGWLDEDRDGLRIHRHLTAAAGAWNDRDRDPSELYRGGRLEGVQGWSRDHGGDLNETEAAFIGAGIKARRAEQAEERKRVSRLRRLLAGAGALLVLALVAGGLALRSQSQAQDREADAEAARSIAETRRIGADAAQLVDTNRRVALLLAAEAYHRDPGPESLGALQRVLSQTGSFLGYLGADRQYRRVAWAGTERVVGLHPSGVDIYDTASGERMVDIDFLAGEALAVSPDGASVAMGASSGPVHLVDAVSGELERELPHPAVVRSIAFSPDSSLVATGDRNGDLRLWSTESGQLLSERDAHWERGVGDLPDGVELGGSAHEPATMPIGVHRLTFSPDGGRIATTGGVFVRVWDVDGLELLTDITVDRVSSVSAQGRGLGRPFDVVFAEGDLLHVATDIFLQTWDSRTGELLVENAPLTGVTAAGFEAFALDVHEDVAVLGTPAGTLRTVRVDSGQIVSVVEIDGGFETQGFDVEIADDGRTVAAAAGGIALFSLDGRGLIADTVAASGLEEILVSADGTRATTTTPRLSSAGVWDLAGRRPAPVSVPDGFYRFFSDHFGPLVGVYAEGSDVYYERLDPETYEPTGLTLGPYSAWQATASPDGSILALGLGRPDLALVKILDTETGQEVTTLMELAGQGGAAVSTLAFNPDGSRLAAAADTGVAHVWDTTTWEPVGPPIAEGGQAVIAMSYSIDGDELLTVNGEGVTTVRDAESYQPTGRQFLGSRNFVSGWQQFGFSDDGQYMVVSLDSQPRLYDYPSGIRIGRAFPGDQALVNVTPDARYATTIIDGTGLIWNLDVDDWVEIACRAAGRNLRVEEWTQFGPTDQPHGATCPQWPSLADEQGD
jgi:WD40 repeat protein